MGKFDTHLRKPGFIREIDGIRGVALTLVVFFHLFGQGRTSGGVDVFLVISAFLLTGSLLRRLVNEQVLVGQAIVAGPEKFRSSRVVAAQLSLGGHFARVATRLVPSAAIVLIAVGLGAVLLMPAGQVTQVFREIFASALYFENWELISSQLAYGAAGPTSSPLQHFWSLSVQGQFFLLWPVIFLLLAALAIRFGISVRSTLLITTLVLTTASLVHAFWFVQYDQPVAYLDTFARFWQLGLGATVAFLPIDLQISRWLREVLIWLGITMIVLCGFLIDGGLLFPGPYALWPVLAILFVFIGTRGMQVSSSAARILALQPFPFLSKISYQLYLWHWPILVFYLIAKDQQGVSWRGGILILVASILAAYLTELLVQKPYASWNLASLSTRRLVPSMAVVAVVALSANLIMQENLRDQDKALLLAAQISPDHPGALALTETQEIGAPSGVDPRPSFDAAEKDLPAIYSVGCIQSWRDEPGLDEVLICEDNVEQPHKRVVVSGGSHVLHWYPALRQVADRNRWELVVVDKDGCRLTEAQVEDGLNPSCIKWNEKSHQVIVDLKPDAVFTVATKTSQDNTKSEQMFPGQVGVWNMLASQGIPTIAIRDTPRFPNRVPECLSKEEDPQNCGRDRAEIFEGSIPIDEYSNLPESITLLDLTDGFCNHVSCEPIVGNVTVYRDADHMTSTFAQTLAPLLEREMRRSAPWMFE